MLACVSKRKAGEAGAPRRSCLLFVLVVFSALFLFGAAASAEGAFDKEDTFKKANELTMKGDALAALPYYEDLIRRIPGDPDLLYNAGTANLMAGKLGPAVLHLERALAVDPDCKDCRINLERALEMQKDSVIVKPTEDMERGAALDQFLKDAGLDGLAAVFLIIHLSLFAMFIARRFSKALRLRFALTLIIVCLFVAYAFSAGLLGLKLHRYENEHYSVVMNEEVIVRKGPNPNYPEAFRVHEGLKIRQGELVEDWRRIWLPNGLNGYVPENDLGKI